MMLWIGGHADAHPDRGIVRATYISIVAAYLYVASSCIVVGWGFTPYVLGAEVASGYLRPVFMSLATGTTYFQHMPLPRSYPSCLSA
ncbi:hypothetical protein P692DRAFT_2080335 [Suillus brevipes Sb2]|nr:hypothetical protein P692DRAFT_2080335 [Suillus brevipes Sb2]